MEEKKIVLDKNPYEEIPSPKDSGLFKRSVGEIKGQRADWRATSDGDVGCVHVVEYSDRYEMHYDKYDPRKKPIEHLLFDSPVYGAIIAAGAVAAYTVLRNILKK